MIKMLMQTIYFDKRETHLKLCSHLYTNVYTFIFIETELEEIIERQEIVFKA